MRDVIDPLRPDRRGLRSIQAPEQVVFDPLEDRWTVSPGAFKRQSDGTISLDLEEVLEADNLPLTHGYPRINRAVGLVAHAVARLRAAGFAVTHVPVEENDYHGEARGHPDRPERDALASTCEIIIALDGDEARRHLDEKLAREAQRRLAQAS